MTTTRQADPRRVLVPLPADFLYQAVTQRHTVTVEVNGILGACRDNEAACAFNYAESATPIVTGLTSPNPAAVGDSLTISGTGLAALEGEDVVVMVGGHACAVTVATDTQVRILVTTLYMRVCW